MATPPLVEKLPLTSADPLAERLARLRGLFPEAAAEEKFDVEKLRALLAGGAARGDERERYGLSWAGKSDALKAIQKLTTATLLPSPGESVNWDTSGNAIIEGDNLEVLKVLQHAYYGKVKLIYIDPPYNTGGDFIYPDNYAEGLGSYLTYLGQVKDGIRQTTNLDTSGRFHSRWLTMMYPRLFLARNLLREDGGIFVSIDDHEVANLRMVMDEIFGEENFVAQIVWQKKYTRSNDAEFFSDNHDHILVYGRNIFHLKLNLLPRTADQESAYSNPDNHRKGPWKATPLHAKSGANQGFKFTFRNGVEWRPPLGTYPRFSEKTLRELEQNDEIWFGAGGKATPSRKTFLCEAKDGVTPITIWPYQEVGHTHEANSELKELGLGGIFENPKPSRLIRRMLELATSPEDDIILDFFAGSGTTAQAVLELNKEDGGNRRFVLVQLPEPTGREDFPTIAEITKERVRRVIKKLATENTENTEAKQGKLNLEKSSVNSVSSVAKNDLGFRVFKLAESNFAIWNPELAAEAGALAREWELSADNVRAGATETALLYELMLKSGLPLHAPTTTRDAGGVSVYLLDGGRVLFCLARELTREQLRTMAEWKPHSVLCLDVAFKGNDALKVNADLEFQSHGIKFSTA